MKDAEIKSVFKDFVGRETDLRNVWRWVGYDTMYYRPHLYTHGKRIMGMLGGIRPVVKLVFPEFDFERATLIGLIHDDPEIFMGDILSGDKAQMNEAQLTQVASKEIEAIEVIAKRFPEFLDKYRYRDLLIEEKKQETPESQLMKLLDKVDALGEALHEIYAGNTVFTCSRIGKYGQVSTPLDYQIENYPVLRKKFTLLQPLYNISHSVFAQPLDWDYAALAAGKKPHSLESVQKPTGYPFYDFWKQAILESGDEEEIKNLYTQKEFL